MPQETGGTSPSQSVVLMCRLMPRSRRFWLPIVTVEGLEHTKPGMEFFGGERCRWRHPPVKTMPEPLHNLFKFKRLLAYLRVSIDIRKEPDC